MEPVHPDIVACYLYTITRHGYPPDAAGTHDYLEEFRALGYRNIELEGIREDHLGRIHSMRGEIRDHAERLGLKIPAFCAVLPGLASPDPKEREKNLLLFEKGCETAVALGARIVLDNAPIPPWQFPEGIPVTRHYDAEVLKVATLSPGLEWNSYREGLVQTYREACDIAAAGGLEYHLHPCTGVLLLSADAFLLFSGEVKRENLKFNLDTANLYFMRENLPLEVIRLEGQVGYIHISDNRGDRVEHLEPGRGTIPWDAFFETLDRTGYDGLFGIDVGGAESDVPDLEEAYRTSAGWLYNRWFKHK